MTISNLVAYNADSRYASIISGLPEAAIEDVTLSNIRIYYHGGGTKEQAALNPPEKETNYPEPSMFGDIPAYGFFIRHARNIRLDNIELSFMQSDARPAFFLQDVAGADFSRLRAQRAKGAAMFVLDEIADFTATDVKGVADLRLPKLTSRKSF